MAVVRRVKAVIQKWGDSNRSGRAAAGWIGSEWHDRMGQIGVGWPNHGRRILNRWWKGAASTGRGTLIDHGALQCTVVGNEEEEDKGHYDLRRRINTTPDSDLTRLSLLLDNDEEPAWSIPQRMSHRR
ncbi:hypothetical protein CRG98_017181 [Punica granatum]|uniref:Uncharacterized protein n=1 Tax=Punica granatum TaxID=22663 RepID=A0A2I0K1D3_PUNGR|nr:hypothetical protein CRG98_017181 [Punica granatum]